MRTAVIAFAILGLASYANAECANACSGHGTCANNDQCMCFPNWMASDCSERVCPYGLSFVDTPRGDLNHDGVRSTGSAGMVSVMSSSSDEFEVYPTDSSTIKDAFENEGHFYTECSNKGLCDRELGLCQCFDGYTGSSCQRTVCPNQCSGHGVCRTVEEIAAGGLNYKKTDSVGSENFWSGMSFSSSVLYRLWDMDKSQGCVCDPGYSGPDCSRRECPRGDDPLTHRNRDCGGAACDNEVQVHTLVAGGAAADWFTIRFREWTGEVWRTDYFQFGNDACIATTDAMRARIIKDQLQAIPNNIFEEIDVTVDATTVANTITITIDFIENSGNIAELVFDNAAREQVTYGNTCTGADTTADYTVTASSNDGTTEESTCSNRGLCDYSTGVCKCFRGYFNDDCSAQNALAGAVSA